MELNEHRDRYNYLTKQLATQERELQAVGEQLSWYRSCDIDELHEAAERARRQKHSCELEFVDCEAKQARNRWRIESVSQIPEFLGFLARFFDKVKAQQDELAAAKAEAAQLRTERARLEQLIQRAATELAEKDASIRKYRSTNPLELEATVAGMRNHVERLILTIGAARVEMDRIDDILAPHRQDYDRLLAQRDLVVNRIGLAEHFEFRLSEAGGRAAAREIHIECESTLGTGRPRRAKEELEKELVRVERDIKKIKERLTTILKRASRIVKSVVIDGNNLCHDRDEFIGLGAVEAAAKRISNQYPVTVVFDRSISSHRRGLGLDQLRDRFGDMITVHVADDKADETVLACAAEPEIYIVSRDNYVEFTDAPAVREQRVIKHEIINNKILILDLDVNETFNRISRHSPLRSEG